ncbi:cadherin-like domain-containing protein [Photobacterium satsumensis]|uniref:cadherin-like domain-containing protein n=1 Tax=Photobacterium satsumensis TaxID=2910239 RepID=UPI003D144BC0
MVDVQSSIAVAASDAGDIDGNAAPSADAIVTTELGSGNDLSFTDADMLAQLTDADSAELTIESVQLVGGQGVLETNSEGQYTFSPAEGFAGQAQIAFVATDGENSIQTHFNVDVAEPEGSAFMLDEMGSLELSQDDLLAALNVGDESTVTAVDYHGEQGTLIEEGDGWVFWSDDDFAGQLPLEVTTSNGQTSSVEQITLEVDEYQDPETSPKSAQADDNSQQNVDIQTTVIENAAESNDISESGEEGSDSDLMAAPGSNVHFEVPDDVAENPDVTQVEISELPDGATIANALLNPDGSYTVSGNLSKPILMKLSDEFEGEATIQFEGQTELGIAVEGASATVTIEVDDEHAMQANQGNNANQPAMQDERGQNGDWTQGDNTNQGVDVMDDSSSYDNDSSGSQQDDTAIMDENI